MEANTVTETLRISAALVATFTLGALIRYSTMWRPWFRTIILFTFTVVAAWRWVIVFIEWTPTWLRDIAIRGDISNGILILVLFVVVVIVHSDYQTR